MKREIIETVLLIIVILAFFASAIAIFMGEGY